MPSKNFPNLTTFGIMICSLFILSSAVNDGVFGYLCGLPFWGLAIWLALKEKKNWLRHGLILVPVILFFLWALVTRETNPIFYPILGERAIVKRSFQIVYFKKDFDRSSFPAFFDESYQKWEQEDLEKSIQGIKESFSILDFIYKKETIPSGTELEICHIAPKSSEFSRIYHIHFCSNKVEFRVGSGNKEDIEELLTLLTYSPSLVRKNPWNPLWPPFDYLSNLMYWPMIPVFIKDEIVKIILDFKNP